MAAMSSLTSNAERPISMVKLRADTHREDDRSLLRLSLVISSKVLEMLLRDQTRPLLHDRTQTSIRLALCLRANSSATYIIVCHL